MHPAQDGEECWADLRMPCYEIVEVLVKSVEILIVTMLQRYLLAELFDCTAISQVALASIIVAPVKFGLDALIRFGLSALHVQLGLIVYTFSKQTANVHGGQLIA